MRTSVDLNDELLRRAKESAARQGTTLRSVIERALRSWLEGRPNRTDYHFRWRPVSGRLRPGVRLDDRSALLDLMEGRE